MIDENGDGSISLPELRKHLLKSGYNEPAVEKVFAKLDIDGDGEITPEELRQRSGYPGGPARTAPQRKHAWRRRGSTGDTPGTSPDPLALSVAECASTCGTTESFFRLDCATPCSFRPELTSTFPVQARLSAVHAAALGAGTRRV